ncbi:hypothetical protein [Rhodopirellula halodulae]|uniref:hypothetical protein n=1 Tax=Rhodopirellula halodulae TaxID=2894198 RepID=UPI001E407471|nr:hypothetical protein [Rhodopirellula sp. JC737]MCC9655817.1 hypothetical protein [Rhodopirellula sp. JC737]
MRLTLRTLLAYLDDMLEEQDTQILKQKIEESSYATSLVARIQAAMDHPQLTALSPDAVGPLENANVISEYLDSTLSAEQIAEIERVCLESDTTLAEAAACHQILTMALGQPARVSDGLKERIYALPASDALRRMEQQTERAPDANPSKTIASAETASYSSLDIPADGNADDVVDAEVASPNAATIAQSDTQSPEPITPVGPSDSGVADAPTRLRNPVGHEVTSSRSEAELVARTTRAMMREEGYGGMVRPSRITPWLVSLGLVAVLLYALGQIFAPLIDRRVAERNEAENDSAAQSSDDLTSSPAESITTQNDTETPAPKPPTPNSQVPKPPTPTDSSTDADSTSPAPAPVPDDTATETVADSEANTEDMPAETTEPKQPSPNEPEPADVSEPQPVEMAPPVPPGMDANDSTPKETSAAASDTTETDPTADAAAPVVEAPAATGETVAKLVNAQAVVLIQQASNADENTPGTSQAWRRLWPAIQPAEGDEAADATTDEHVRAVGSGQMILAPSLYRPILQSDHGIEWTLAGPTRVTLAKSETEDVDAETDAEEETTEASEETNQTAQTITSLHNGRLLLASTEPDVSTKLQLGPKQIQLSIPESQTVLAIELAAVRPLGMDPRVPRNRRLVYRVIAVQGSVQLTVTDTTSDDNADAVTLEEGQQWRASGNAAAEISDMERLPNWIDPPEKADLLVTSAREGLLEFVSHDGGVDDDELEKELREAMAFRRVEVSALAAQTLLLIGRADVYFGANGILSTPRHRLYFTEHFQQLRQHMASDAEAAKALDEAIQKAEQADGDTLFELLVGYNNEQLEAGKDAELIEHLGSSSMSVRVLAIENLRDIVGDTLGYRPDQENVARRNSDIKKWQSRLRRGDIRYSDAE